MDALPKKYYRYFHRIEPLESGENFKLGKTKKETTYALTAVTIAKAAEMPSQL